MQEPSQNIIKNAILRFLLYAIFTGAMVLVVTWEAKHASRAHLFDEDSILEGLQALILFLTAGCAYLAGHVKHSEEPLASVLMGAACIAAVREFDAALDRYVFDGAWQILALAIGIATVIHMFRNQKALKTATLDFLKRPSFGIMASGFISVFIFSRLMGRQLLWRAIMGEEYLRVVKIAVEESFELLGYILIFIGAIEFLYETLRAKAHASQRAPFRLQNIAIQKAPLLQPPTTDNHRRPSLPI